MEEYENEELETEEIDLTSPIDKELNELEPIYKAVAEIKSNVDNLNAILGCTFLTDETKIEAIKTIREKSLEKITIK